MAGLSEKYFRFLNHINAYCILEETFLAYQFFCLQKIDMPQKGLKNEKRGTGRKEKNFPEKFFFCLPVLFLL